MNREKFALCARFLGQGWRELAHLEGAGFHTTQQMPTDQRRVLVRLATKGDQLINRMASLIELQYQLIE